MRTITTEVYKFDELSDEAKDKAYNQWLNSDREYFGGDDAVKSLEKFVDHFNGRLTRWSFDFLEPYRNSFGLDLPDNMSDDDVLLSIESLGSYDKETLMGNGDCVLTGYCMDESLGYGIRKAWYNEGERDLRELIMAGIQQWEHDVMEDCEYEHSTEFFVVMCEANEYEFDINGNMI